jgi:hypothetical protein
MKNEKGLTIKRIQNTEDVQKTYCCMTDIPTPWPQALCQCRDWVTNNLGKHVEGYHLEQHDGEVIGHLYFALSDQALFPYRVEHGVVVLYCEWIQKRHQGSGYGRLLFDEFISDRKKEDKLGVLVEATDIEGQMHFRHYTVRGFNIIHEQGHRKLLYYPIKQTKVNVQPIVKRISPKRVHPVEVLILNGYMCPYEVSTMIKLRSIVPEFGEQVILRDVWLTPDTLQEFGAAKGVFINGDQKLVGGETETAIRLAIQEEL